MKIIGAIIDTQEEGPISRTLIIEHEGMSYVWENQEYEETYAHTYRTMEGDGGRVIYPPAWLKDVDFFELWDAHLSRSWEDKLSNPMEEDETDNCDCCFEVKKLKQYKYEGDIFYWCQDCVDKEDYMKLYEEVDNA